LVSLRAVAVELVEQARERAVLACLVVPPVERA
jgi:hypothetical protein